MQREDELALVVEEQRGRVALSQTELAQSHIEVDALRTKLAESAAQLAAQAAELRALRRTAAEDKEKLRASEKAREDAEEACGAHAQEVVALRCRLLALEATVRNSRGSQVARDRREAAEKANLAAGVEQLAAQLIEARRDKQAAEAAHEKTLVAARRLAELGQLGLRLLDETQGNPIQEFGRAAQRLGVAELLMAGVAATPLKSPPKSWRPATAAERHRAGAFSGGRSGGGSRRLSKEEALRLGEHIRAGRS